MSLQGGCLSSWGFLAGVFCPWVFRLEGFIRHGFCPSPLLSEYIHYNRKLSITFNFRFHMYEKNLKSVTSHAIGLPLPLSQTVTPSRTPCPLELDILYGRPLMRLSEGTNHCPSALALTCHIPSALALTHGSVHEWNLAVKLENREKIIP